MRNKPDPTGISSYPLRFLLAVLLSASVLILCDSYSSSLHAQVAPITPSGLNTQVNLSATPPVGGMQYDITGGTRPGGGANLFHSFGEFGVPTNNIANFLNGVSFDLNGNSLAAGLPTSNILGRVTGVNVSNIFGTIQTTGFGNANLFLMNPTGFLFGPNAAVNVGGMVAFTTADYLKLTDNARFNAIPDATADALLTASPVAGFGFLGSNPGAITVQGSQLMVTKGAGISLVGGNITVQSGILDGGIVQPARLAAPGGQINLASIASAGEVSAGDFMPASGMTRGSITLAQATLDVSTNATGTVRIRGGELVMAESTIFGDSINNSDGAATVVDINVTDNLSIDGPGSGIFTNTVGEGTGGNIFINANSVTLQNGGTLSAKTSGTEATATGGTITVHAYQVNTDGATITVETTGAGQAGSIALITQPKADLTADAINLNNSVISSSTFSNANAGDVLLQTGSLHVENTVISSDAIPFESFTGGNAGTIKAQVSGDITLMNSSFSTSTVGNGNAGNITLAGTNLQAESSSLASHAVAFSGLSGGNGGTIHLDIDQDAHLSNSSIDSQTVANGNAGNVFVDAASLTLNSSSLSTGTSPGEGFTGGNAGNIQVTAGQLTMNDGLIVSQSLFSAGSGGMVTVTASESITTSGSGIFPFAISTSTDGAAPICPGTCGNAGSVTLMTPTMVLNGVGLNSTSTGQGNAGSILAKVGTLTIMNGAQISASAEGLDVTGAGGTITIQGLASPAQSVLIDGPGSSIFTETQGSGTGGNISVNANSVTLTNRATVSASSTGQIDNPGNAGSIDITATNGLTMQNSAITTQAGQGASGGDIKVTTSPSAMVLLENSRISASVADGPGGGGNISIDPQYVILQNSQILAQAAQGQGGAITITITNGGLYLPDANSIVNADSGSGLHGTVTIQSPNDPAGGKIQPLGKSPLLATSLLNQRCAALAGGEFSSFTVAGRDSLPTEPGSWLTSPLALATLSAGTGIAVRGKELEDITLGASLADETTLLLLRQIAPAGFLTQAFALDWSTSCQS